MALPANVGTCLVTGTFIRAVIDSADADRDPDGVPIEGLTVKFTASVPMVRNVSAVPPVMVFMDPITCTTNTSGTLIGLDGQPGIRLVASDDPDLDPSGWTYKAELSAPTLPKFSFSFVAPDGGTVDLSTVVPVPPAPGASLVAWQEAVVTATAARDIAVIAAADADAARDEAVIAAADADAARDEAVTVAAAIPATNDPIVAALVNDPASETAMALSPTIGATAPTSGFWIQENYIKDTFTDADWTPLGGRTTDTVGAVTTRIWDGATTVGKIDTNQALIDSSGAGAVKLNHGLASFRVTITAVTFTPNMLFRLRYQDSNNNLYIQHSSDSGHWALFSRVSGTATLIFDSGVVPAANDVLEVTADGTSYSLKVNDVPVGSGTSSNLSTNTIVGLAGEPGSRWDDLIIDTL